MAKWLTDKSAYIRRKRKRGRERERERGERKRERKKERERGRKKPVSGNQSTTRGKWPTFYENNQALLRKKFGRKVRERVQVGGGKRG